MPIVKSISEISRMIDRQLALVTWADANIKAGTKLRFKGSRSNAVRGQYRQVIEMRESKEGFYGYNKVDGRFDVHNIPNRQILSKNVIDGAKTHAVVVAENSLATLMEVMIDGEWVKTKDLPLVIDPNREKYSVSIAAPNAPWDPINRRSVCTFMDM